MIRLTLITMLAVCWSWLPMRAALIDFEGLADAEAVTNQFQSSGVVFTNATALSAGIGLNEAEFPPRSGFNVIADLSGPIAIDFDSAQDAVSAYLTYTEPLTMSAFDAANGLLGSVSSAAGCVSNLALSGSAGCLSNELLALTGLSGIRRVTISGNLTGVSFTLDDLEFTAGGTTVIPEPSSLALLVCAGCALAVISRRKRP